MIRISMPPHSTDDKIEAQSIKEIPKVIFKARNGTEMKTQILRVLIQGSCCPSQLLLEQ